MEKLVPNWYSAAQPLPETCIFPPDARPGKFSIAPSRSDIPVINHCIPEALMNDTMDVLKEFFELPLEEKRIISNGKLKCDEHQVVTNSSTVWTTFGFFITPSPDCCIEPAAALINASNPRLYKGFRYEEFPANYFRKQGKTEVVLEPFEIEC
ncbi:hyoscyamine 6-dioxygenase [Rosa chinensis]|uniref:hyoscyamine 6-dioxygenase n=1 Tax=Rosa chinensis TaxID=74649 RepID=UPI000D08E6F3|nr:hyoscyamine 6-dioxygenase [Rosa chinensis]